MFLTARALLDYLDTASLEIVLTSPTERQIEKMPFQKWPKHACMNVYEFY